MMGRMLTDADIEGYHRDGFVAVRGAFPREVAESCVELLWPRLGVDRDDPTSWRAPVIRLGGFADPPFVAAGQAPALHQAFDQLLGVGRWVPKLGLGTFPVRFPSEADPGDAGWHVDATYESDGRSWVDHRSSRRAMLLLFLFSDVGPEDAPTRIRVGSHRVVAPLLAPAGDAAIPWMDACIDVVPATDHLPVAHATGGAGDVYLCHPFLVHSATFPHRGTQPRFLAQPGLEPAPAG